ncbi:alpha/beta hydrolase-fold protein [Peristeroidobacter agariperforans]|uniref:alpha/beta hydrolase-fold protein n=1 Tax=Peristeroidobacter agariperforans TaxID=268404 RepID=UPI0018E54D20|nr:alpha/beta hydrolase-fold protein [Peristeroidobacter agariperforans]
MLKEGRTVHIYLPESYPQSRGYRRYPVLYVRDGGKFFHSFTGAVQHLTSDATPHVPEIIVVAIVETDRVRDSSSTRSLQGFTGKTDEGFKSSGGGENFRQFLQHELVPYIDNEFSTSSYRIYCGYSFTGLSVIDEFLDVDTIFLMIDPSWWWDDYVMERRAAVALPGRKFNRVQLFMAATGESYPEKYFIKARDISSLAEVLQRTNPAGLEWKLKRYADESHHSMALRALHDGLTYFFRGYQPSLHELYMEPEKLRSRYESLSARLGERVSLREDLLRFFGEQFLRNFKEPDQAIRYFEMAADAYPGSWAAWDDLGDAYMAKGDKLEAVKLYEKSLLLNPQNENANKMLKSLRAE